MCKWVIPVLKYILNSEFICAAPEIAKILNPIDWHGWMGRLKDKYIVGYTLADRWTDRSAQMY